MIRFNRFAVLLFSFFALSSFAQPIKVRLEAPRDLVASHTPAVLFGVRLSSGNIVGSGLFTDADLRAGVLEKTIYLDPSDKVESCEYEWLITADPAPGVTNDPLGRISMPRGFDGDLKGKCEVNFSKGELLLPMAPFSLERLEVYVASSSLANRKAKAAVAIVTPKGEQGDKYGSFSLGFNESTTFPITKTVYLLAREPLSYQVQTFWRLKVGGSDRDSREYKDNFIEVK